MTFKGMLDSDMDIFFNTDEFAETAEYRYQDAEPPTSISVLTDFQADLETTSIGQRATGFIFCRKDQLADEPKFKDTVTVFSKKWIVDKVVQSGDGRAYQLLVYRDARAILSKANK